MDAATLAKAMGHTLSMADYERYVEPFNEALIAADCTTPQRVAMFCAQIGHESNGLLWMEELASGDAYEGRQDLGNVFPGDGRRYKGSGPIQLTGRYNFRRFSEWCYGQGLVNSRTFFEDHPELVRNDPRWGFLAASWYWTVQRPMNSYADRGDIRGATIAVNGGTTNLQDRTNRWNRCLQIGAALLPSEGDLTMAAKDDIIKFIQIYLGPVISDVKDIREQLTGSRDLVIREDGSTDWKASFKGWRQLGQNADGSNKTVVDSLGDARDRVVALEGKVKSLEATVVAALAAKK